MRLGFRCLAWLIALVATISAARAEDPAALYTADAIVTGTDMRQRPWGFAQCLTEVLVKVAGDPTLRDDPRVPTLAEHADALVASFDYADLMAGIKKKDDQGSYDRPHRLTVHFDPTKIDAALAELGRQPWRGERPIIVPVLLVSGPALPRYLLDAETPRGEAQRDSFTTWAASFGLSVRFPTIVELARWNITAEHFPDGAPTLHAGVAIVIGTLDWNETLPGWVGSWRLHWQGADHRWGISGVNYDAAFRDIMRGVVLVASGRGSPD